MASDFPLCIARDLSLLPALLAVLTISASAHADEAATHRPEFQDCDDLDRYPALDHVHPSQTESRGNVYFYYIADVQDCPDSSRVSVRHTVKNLHPSKPLKFSWEGTPVFHIGLKPGSSCCEPALLPSYNDSPFVSQILYGVSLDYAVPATIYPLPLLSQRDSIRPIDMGDVLISKLDTEYIDSDGNQREIHVQVSSSYRDDNLIAYSFTKDPSDLVLALGSLAETSAGQLIVTSLSADVGHLGKFVDKERAWMNFQQCSRRSNS
jgi:hypothetical protein